MDLPHCNIAAKAPHKLLRTVLNTRVLFKNTQNNKKQFKTYYMPDSIPLTLIMSPRAEWD